MYIICAPIVRVTGKNSSRVLPKASAHMDKRYFPDLSSSLVMQVNIFFA